jgi:ABC-type proline/glycine betaine transport system ATPase subunit
VSIACELITEPSLLLLDEPTTGLDSNNAENVALGLRNLADEGRLVVTTIHQPSSEVLELFDQILILHKGKRVFDGPYEELRPFFGTRGIDIPLNCNCIEFLINLINIDRNSVKLLEEQVDKKFSQIFNEEIIAKIEQIIEAENAHDIVRKLEKRDEGRRSSQIDLDKIANPLAKARRTSSILLQKGRSFNEEDFEMLLEDNRDKKQSIFRTMVTLYSRGTTCLVRNPANFKVRLIQVTVQICIRLLLFFRLGYGKVGIQNREGNMYNFMMTF